MRRRLRIALVAALAAPFGGCWDFQPDVPDGPTPLPGARLVSVRVEYRQPQHCANEPAACSQRVVFFGSWMRPPAAPAEAGVLLEVTSGGYVWTGTVPDVPVNFPPGDVPHFVRVFDPHLWDTPTGGVTAARLVVGGQMLTQYEEPGTPRESGLVYVDDNGIGHNPP